MSKFPASLRLKTVLLVLLSLYFAQDHTLADGTFDNSLGTSYKEKRSASSNNVVSHQNTEPRFNRDSPNERGVVRFSTTTFKTTNNNNINVVVNKDLPEREDSPNIQQPHVDDISNKENDSSSTPLNEVKSLAPNGNSMGDSISSARGLLSNLLAMNDTSLTLDKIRERFFNDIKLGRKFTTRDCLLCRFSASIIQYALLTTKGEQKINDLARNFCIRARWESMDVCSSITRLFREEVVKVLAYALFTPDQICGLLSDNQCGHFYDPYGDWSVSLEASEHLDIDVLHQYGINEKNHQIDIRNRTQTKPYKVIHISDTHVDLNYLTGSFSDCEEPLCCQATSTRSTGLLNRIDSSMEADIGFQRMNYDKVDADGKAGYWGSYSHCDIPIRTFEQLLMTLNETIAKNKDIDYIIWTGDIQPHDVWKQSKNAAIQTYEAVFKMINEYLPNIKIFPTLGNHEMIPVDSFSPSNLWNIAKDDSPSWLYKELDKFWSKWLPPSTETTILNDGNYAATARPGLKIISLNTNYCHSNNLWLFINATDPGNQLQWLVHELQISELLEEKVHIIGHIPPGADDCLRVWSKNFNRIIRRYKTTVTSQFYGHTHNNEFQIFYDIEKVSERITSKNSSRESSSSRAVDHEFIAADDGEQTNNYIEAPLVPKSEPTNQEKLEAAKVGFAEPISVGFIGPSTTTFVGLNPSYRIYTMNPLQGFLPVDFDTYYLNLTAANEISKKATMMTSLDNLHIKSNANSLNNSITPKLSMDKVRQSSTGKTKRKTKKQNISIANKAEAPMKLDWVYGGSFAQTFNIPDVSPQSMHRLINSIGKNLDMKDKIPESLKNLMTRLSHEEDQQNHIRSEFSQNSDDLYKLYRLFYNYSDLYGPEQYAKCDHECRRLFLCRYLTGESQNSSLCIKYIRNGQPRGA